MKNDRPGSQPIGPIDSSSSFADSDCWFERKDLPALLVMKKFTTSVQWIGEEFTTFNEVGILTKLDVRRFSPFVSLSI